MTSSLHHTTSWWGSSHFEWVIQSAAFLPRHTHMHAHELQNILQIPHSSSSFWRGNILDVLVALYPGIHFVSAFFTSVLMVSVIVSFVPHVLYFCTCTPSIIGLLTFQMTTWSFRDALVELEVRGSLRQVCVVERARFTYGGYLLHRNTDHF